MPKKLYDHKTPAEIIGHWNFLLSYNAKPGEHETMKAIVNHTGFYLSYIRQYSRDADTEHVLKKAIGLPWEMYDDNFIHFASHLYEGLKDSKWQAMVRESELGRMIAVSYALLMDVLPERRNNLRKRLEWWLDAEVPEENVEHYTTLVLDTFNVHSSHVPMMVQMIQLLDEQESRNASVSHQLLHPECYQHQMQEPIDTSSLFNSNTFDNPAS